MPVIPAFCPSLSDATVRKGQKPLFILQNRGGEAAPAARPARGVPSHEACAGAGGALEKVGQGKFYGVAFYFSNIFLRVHVSGFEASLGCQSWERLHDGALLGGSVR